MFDGGGVLSRFEAEDEKFFHKFHKDFILRVLWLADVILDQQRQVVFERQTQKSAVVNLGVVVIYARFYK